MVSLSVNGEMMVLGKDLAVEAARDAYVAGRIRPELRGGAPSALDGASSRRAEH